MALVFKKRKAPIMKNQKRILHYLILVEDLIGQTEEYRGIQEVAIVLIPREWDIQLIMLWTFITWHGWQFPSPIEVNGLLSISILRFL